MTQFDVTAPREYHSLDSRDLTDTADRLGS